MINAYTYVCTSTVHTQTETYNIHTYIFIHRYTYIQYKILKIKCQNQ